MSMMETVHAGKHCLWMKTVSAFQLMENVLISSFNVENRSSSFQAGLSAQAQPCHCSACTAGPRGCSAMEREAPNVGALHKPLELKERCASGRSSSQHNGLSQLVVRGP